MTKSQTSSFSSHADTACDGDDYPQAMEYLFNRINYERTQPKGKPSKVFKLERMQKLLQLVGDPQAQVPTIHIAGTKGKGSTAVMLAEILQAAGYCTGLFTSPHISQYEERMRVNGEMPTKANMVQLIEQMQKAAFVMEQMTPPMVPTFFEMTTAMAWLYFVEQKVDVAVLEVGLGGRLDSTNVCQPELTVITNISHDHTAILGKTLPEIAREKGGIIKEHVPVVCGIQNEEPLREIKKICKARSAPLIERGKDFSYSLETSSADDASLLQRNKNYYCSINVKTTEQKWDHIPVPLAGMHQAENAALAVATIDQMTQLGWRITEENIQQGMQSVRLPVRIELIQTEPTIIIDAAHNCASISKLIETLADKKHSHRFLVYATSRDKDVRGMLEILLPAFDSVIFTQYLGNPRAMPVDELVSLAKSVDQREHHFAKTPKETWQLASELVSPSDLLCVTGSFFIAAEMRELICS